MIIECKSQKIKSSDRKEGVGQLQSYMSACPNVAYGMWTNGDEQFCFAKRSTLRAGGRSRRSSTSPVRAERGRRPATQSQGLKVATSDTLLFAFRRCHNYIAGHEGMQKTEAFWELLKMIFMQDPGRAAR